MIFYFFKKLPAILFEPVAITAFLGLCFFLVSNRKKRGLDFYLVILAVSFLIGWRVLACSIMASKRYSEILICPGILFAVYLCGKTGVLFRWIVRKTGKRPGHSLRSLGKHLPLLCVAVLALAGLMKVFRPAGRRSNHILQICSVINRDAMGRQPVYLHSLCTETPRLNYGCRVPVRIVQGTEPENDPDFLRYVSQCDNIPGTHYFVRKKNERKQKNQIAVMPADREGLTVLVKVATYRKKDQEIILYRYEPPCKNIREWRGTLPEFSQNDAGVVKRYDFERVGRTRRLKDGALIFLPAEWGVDPDPVAAEKKSITTLSASRPLAGRRSLFLEARGENQLAGIYSIPVFEKADYSCSFFVRGDSAPRAKVVVQMRGRKAVSGETSVFKKLIFLVEKDKICRIHWNVLKNEIPDGERDFFILIYVFDGAVTIDQFEVRKINDMPQA